MRRATTLILLVSVMIAIASAANEKKMTIEAALSIRDVGAPQWSPDGKWIAFTVSDWNKKEVRRDSHIHLISATGGQPIRLTNGERGESAPQWSPDGTRIAFLANRDAAQPAPGSTPRGNQVWMISIGGGEAERVTDEESPVSQFRWSPDGKSIAYIVRDTPKDKAEREKRKKEKFDAIVVNKEFTYSHLWTISLDKRRRSGSPKVPLWLPIPSGRPTGVGLLT